MTADASGRVTRGPNAHLAPEALRRRMEIGAERRAATLERLFAAAFTVAAEKGLDVPVIADFIAAAGVSQGTFYNYFKNKEELVAALAERLERQQIADDDLLRLQVADPAARLVVGVRLNIRRAQREPVWGRVFTLDRLQRLASGDFNAGVRRDVVNAIAAHRLRLRDPELALEICYSLLAQAMRRAASGRGPDNLDELTATAILASLGVPYDEAEAIGSAPLPQFGDAESSVPG